MSNHIKAEHRFQAGSPPLDDHEVSEERFLIDEGLELLANYRSIKDKAKRRAVRDLVARAAGLQSVG